MSKKPPVFQYSALTPSLKNSVKDGIFYALMFGAGESYLSAFGVFLGLSPVMIGLLATLPLFIGSLSQLLGVRFMERNISRRKIIVSGVRIQALSWLIIATIPWLPHNQIITPLLLILAVILYSTAGQIVVPSWTSLMGDLVPTSSRGMFFGSRNKIAGYFVILSFILAGYILNYSKTLNAELITFTALFLFAFIVRLISSIFLSKHEDPEYIFTADDKFTLWQFIKRTKDSNFARFVFFHAALHFGLFVAGPYFVIYMLRDLSLSYAQFSLISVSALAANYLTMRWWGQFGDRFGNKKILTLCCTYMVVAPMLWVFSDNLIYLILIQLASGSSTAGIQIASMNFLLDAVTPGKRGRCAAFMNFITALFVICGSMFGALLVGVFEVYALEISYLGLSPLLALFISTTILRLIIIATLIPRFNEVREVEHLSYSERAAQISKIIPLASYTTQLVVGTFRNRLNKNRKK